MFAVAESTKFCAAADQVQHDMGFVLQSWDLSMADAVPVMCSNCTAY